MECGYHIVFEDKYFTSNLNILVGNMFCNDEANIADCNYDGGDCCGTCTLRSRCMECACLSGADDDICQSKPNSL